MERVDPVVAFALTPRFWTTVGENLHCVDTEWFERGVHEIREQAHRIAARDEEFKGLRDLVCRYCSRMQREGWGSLKGLNSMAPACVSSALDGLAQCAEVLVDNGWPAIALLMFDEVWLLTFWLQCVIHAVMMVEPGGDTEVEHDRAGEVGAQPESIRSGVRPDVMTDSGMEGHGTTSASGRSMWERSSCVLAVTADFWGWVVDGKRTERGWRAHRDRSMLSVPPNTMPEYITFWSALSEATPDSACMYVVPATYDSHYHVPHGDGDVPLSDVRALPAASGDVLSWSGRLLHWGGRYDAEQRGAPHQDAFARFLLGLAPHRIAFHRASAVRCGSRYEGQHGHRWLS